MEEKVLRSIEKYAMLKSGDNVIAALSGGADSVALFHFLAARREFFNIRLSAAHLEHGLRGQESLEDLAYVRRLCEEAGVTLYVERAHMAEREAPRGLGVEEWGRRLRYAFFERLAEEHKAKVALAHTLSDNAETVLFRAIRGTGPKGLGGIPPLRGRYVRPLIEVSRAEVEDYCKAHGLAYMHDATNDDVRYSRNRLRRQVMPLLEEAHPGAARSLARLAGDMRALDEWIAGEAAALLARAGAGGEGGYSAEALLHAPAPLRLAALAALAGPKANRAGLARMEAVLAGSPRAAQLPGSALARLYRGRLYLEDPAKPQKEPPELALREGLMPLWDGYKLALRLHAQPPAEAARQKSAQKGLLFAADYDKINGCERLRTRRPGDTFAPAGRAVSKTLKKWMNEAGVPPPLRARLPLLANGGKVLWVWGAGFAESLRPGADTRRWFTLEAMSRAETNIDGIMEEMYAGLEG